MFTIPCRGSAKLLCLEPVQGSRVFTFWLRAEIQCRGSLAYNYSYPCSSFWFKLWEPMWLRHSADASAAPHTLFSWEPSAGKWSLQPESCLTAQAVRERQPAGWLTGHCRSMLINGYSHSSYILLGCSHCLCEESLTYTNSIFAAVMEKSC